MIDVLIIGGGLAGLINALLLSRAGLTVSLIEKKRYPFHRVCGEYISNEVVPFLKSIDAYPENQELPSINKFILSDTYGNTVNLRLPLGGFGVSRYFFDNYLFEKAQKAGCTIFQGLQVITVSMVDDCFESELSNGTTIKSKIVIGAHGKRSRIDKSLKRAFIEKRSPYIGVKYHVKTNFPAETVALYNFKKGYFGINSIENGRFNICYLSHRDNLSHTSDIQTMEREILGQNPHIKTILEQSEFLQEKPLVINEISFSAKKAVENHVLMAGDAAGMITPLCGNGMAMAIHSAKILSGLIIFHLGQKKFNRSDLENEYETYWNNIFKRRLQFGRMTQKFFGQRAASTFTVALAKNSKLIADFIIRQSHGAPF